MGIMDFLNGSTSSSAPRFDRFFFDPNEYFEYWLNNASIDELKECLSQNFLFYDYMSNNMKDDGRRISGRIELSIKNRTAIRERRAKLEQAEIKQRENVAFNNFMEYLHETEKNILNSHDVFNNFKNNAISSFNDFQKELLKERYEKNIEYIQSIKFLEDNDNEFGSRNLMWLVNKQKPDAGKKIIALILSNHTYIDLLDKQIESAKKQDENSLVKSYLQKLQKDIISSHKMFEGLPDFYKTLPEVYKAEIKNTDKKNKDTVLSLDFLRGIQSKTILEKLQSKSIEIGKDVFELALKRPFYYDKIESNIKNAKNMREETEWTEIKDAFYKFMVNIENAVKTNSPSDDNGFPKTKEMDTKTVERFLKLKTKINDLLTEIEKIIIINSSNNVTMQEIVTHNNMRSDNFQMCIAASSNITVGLKKDGTVITVGDNYKGRCDTQDWSDIIAVSAHWHTVGLKKDGTVVAIGYNEKGQCNTQNLRDIVAVSAGADCTVGLKKDGTVVAVGDNWKDKCDTQDWSDIIAVSAGGLTVGHIVGVKKDGTVVAAGINYKGSCDTQSWRDIIAVSAGQSHTVGLKEYGTVVAVGDNKYGQCNTQDWRDIVAISAGSFYTVGLKKDGTVIAVGENSCSQCDTQNWRDIIAVSAGESHTVGLKKDGTVITVGNNNTNQCDTKKWRDIGPATYDNELPDEIKNMNNDVTVDKEIQHIALDNDNKQSTREIPDKTDIMVIDKKKPNLKSKNEIIILEEKITDSQIQPSVTEKPVIQEQKEQIKELKNKPEKTTMPVSQVNPIVETSNTPKIESTTIVNTNEKPQPIAINNDDKSVTPQEKNTIHTKKKTETKKTSSEASKNLERFEINRQKYYDEAIDKMQNKNYREAINTFQLIDDYKNYKDVKKLVSECVNELKTANLSNPEYQSNQQIIEENEKYAKYKKPGIIKWFLFTVACLSLGFFVSMIILIIVDIAMPNELGDEITGRVVIISTILASILGRILLKRRVKFFSEKNQLYSDSKSKLDALSDEVKMLEQMERGLEEE